MQENNHTSRRNFLKNTSLATIASLSIPELVTTAFATEKIKKKVTLQKDDVILFQGDSITDAGRRKDDTNFNN
ncbi:MAG: twin-arginine translocation signal domain-containing protein, partial [Flavisolibacter sp.]|nr:twin-arginine translocation signal domain-containing protein [Flavisolibacter sp.]